MAVTLHTYTDTEWKNAPDHKTTPINATNLNNIETGMVNVYGDLADVYSEMGTEDAKKTDKSDMASISINGSTNDTDSTIASGTYFYLNGALVKSTASISNGATLTENTNYTVVTAGALNDLVSANSDAANKLSGRISIDAYYTTSNLYTFGYDGYVEILPQDNTKTGIIYVFGSDNKDSTKSVHISSSDGIYVSLFVRKGMRCYCTGNAAHYYIALI